MQSAMVGLLAALEVYHSSQPVMLMLSLRLAEGKGRAEKFVEGSVGGWIKEGVIGRYIFASNGCWSCKLIER